MVSLPAAANWAIAPVGVALEDWQEEGKNPFSLDSKAPTSDYKGFIDAEVRYSSLERANPERAQRLFGNAEKYAKEKYDHKSQKAHFP